MVVAVEKSAKRHIIILPVTTFQNLSNYHYFCSFFINFDHKGLKVKWTVLKKDDVEILHTVS